MPIAAQRLRAATSGRTGDSLGAVQEDGGPRQRRTRDEEAFLSALLRDRPWLDVWLHEDEDGTPWACVSYDFSRDGAVVKTLRLDFDGGEVLGGWSPAALNWDDGVRARAAGMDVHDADVLCQTGDATSLADAAGRWFDRHRAAWERQ